MDTRDIVGILTPAILLIFAGTFMVLGRVRKKERYSYNLAIGFFLIAIGYATSWLSYESAPQVSLIFPGITNLIAPIFFARGLLLRGKSKVPYKPLGIIAALGTLLSVITVGVFENISLYFILGSAATAVQIGFIAHSLTKNSRRSNFGAMVNWILASTLILLTGHSIFNNLNSSAALEVSNYQSSIEWISLNLVVIIQATIGSICYVMFTLTEAMKALQFEADTDELTGLARKGRFEKEAKRIFAQTKRTPLPVSLIVCDIDNFKQVNDKFGHLTGDKVLAEVSRMIRNTSRSTDIVGRIGGEEFAVLLWNADIKGARLVAEQLRGTLENHDFGALLDGQPCTASFGVAQLEEGESYQDLFALADRALYRAKNTGRNRVNAATFVLEDAA